MRYSQRTSEAGLIRPGEEASEVEQGRRAALVEVRRRQRMAWARGRHTGENGSASPGRTVQLPTSTWSASAPVLERARVLRGWTRGQLAQAARVDPKTLGDFMGGRRRPQLGTVRALCMALELKLSDVIVFAEGAEQATG